MFNNYALVKTRDTENSTIMSLDETHYLGDTTLTWVSPHVGTYPAVVHGGGSLYYDVFPLADMSVKEASQAILHHETLADITTIYFAIAGLRSN